MAGWQEPALVQPDAAWAYLREAQANALALDHTDMAVALDIGEPYKSLDLGLSADFFDRRLSLYLNVDDIFDWNEWGSSSINPYYTSSSTSKYTSRYVTFGLTLRFGKMELADRSREGIQSGGGHSGQGAQ